MFGHLLTLVACIIEITRASPIYPHQNRRAMNHSHYKIFSHTETQFKGLFLDEVTQELKTQIGYNKSVVLTDHKIGENIIRAYLETSTNNPPFRPILNEFKQNLNDHFNVEDDQHFSNDELALPSEVIEKFLKLDDNQSKDLKMKMEHQHNLDSSSTASVIEKNTESGDELTSTEETPSDVRGNEKNGESRTEHEDISKSTFESYANDITSESNPIKPLSSHSLLSEPEQVRSQPNEKEEVTEQNSHKGEMTSEGYLSESDASSDDITITEKDLAFNFDDISTDSTLNQEKDKSLINLSEEWNQLGDWSKKVATEEASTEGYISPSTSETSVESGHKINDATLSDEKTDFFEEGSTILNLSSEHSPKAIINDDLSESLIHLDELGEVASASDVKENRVKADTHTIVNQHEDFQGGLSEIQEKEVSTDRYMDSLGENSPSENQPIKTTSVEQDVAFVHKSITGDTSKDSETEESLIVSSEVWNQPEDVKKEEFITEGYTSSQDFHKISSSEVKNAEKDLLMVRNSSTDSFETFKGDNLETSESFDHLNGERNPTEDDFDEKIKTERYNEIDPSILDFSNDSGSKPDELLLSDEKTELFDLTTEAYHTSSDEHPVKHTEEDRDEKLKSSSETVDTNAESSREKSKERNSNELEKTFYETKSQETTYSNEKEHKSQDSFETEHNLSNADEKDLPNSSFDDHMGERTLEEGTTVVFENSESKQHLSSEDFKFKNELYNFIENDHKSTIKVHSSGSFESTTYETEVLSDPISPSDALVVTSSNDDGENWSEPNDSSKDFQDETSTTTSSPTQKNVRSSPDFSTTYLKSEESTTPSNGEHPDGHSGTNSEENLMSPSEIVETFAESSKEKSKEKNSKELEKSFYETKSQESTYSNEIDKSQGSTEIKHNLSNADENDIPIPSFDDRNEERFVEHGGSTVVYENRESKQPPSSDDLKFKNEESFNAIENDHSSTVDSTQVHSFEDSGSTTHETETLSDNKSPSDVVSSSNDEEDNLSEQNDSSKDFQDETSTTTSSPTQKNMITTQDFSMSNPEELTTPTNVEYADQHSGEKEMSPSEILETFMKSSRAKSKERNSNELEKTLDETKSQETTYSNENEHKSQDSFETEHNLSNAEERDLPDSSFDDHNEERFVEQGSTIVYENSKPKQPLSSEDLKYKNEESSNSIENDHTSIIEVHSSGNSGSTTYENEIFTDPISPSDALIVSSSNDEATTTSSPTQKNMMSTQDFSMTNPEELTTPTNVEYADQNSDEKEMSPSEILETYMESSREKSKERNSNALEKTLYETKSQETTYSNENEHKSRDSFETEHNLSNANENDLPNSSFDDHMGERTLEEGTTVVFENSESKQHLSSEDFKFKNELYNSIENDHTSTIEVHSSGSSESTTYETEILSDPISPSDALVVSSSNDEATTTSSPTQKNMMSTQDFSMTNPQELTTPTNVEHADQYSDEKEMSPSEILETFAESSREKSKERNSNELEKTLDETKSQERTYSNENEHKSRDSFETEDNLSNTNENDLPNSSFDDRMGERTLEEGTTVVFENSGSKQPLSSEDLKYKNEESSNSIENDHTSTIEVHLSGSSESTTYENEIFTDPISPSDALVVSSSNEEATTTSSPTQKNMMSTEDFSMANPEELTTTTNVEHADQNSDEKEMSPSEILETYMESSREKSKDRNSNELEKTLYETKSQETTYSNENEHKSQDSFETERNLSNADEKDLPDSSFDDHNEERFVEQGSTIVYENSESKQPLSSEDLKFKNELYNSIENDHKSTIEVHSSGSSESTTYETEILSDPISPPDALGVSSSNDEATTTSSPTQKNVRSTPDFSMTNPVELTTPTNVEYADQHSDENEMSPSEILETFMKSSRAKSKERNSNELEKTLDETKSQETTYSNENEHKSQDSFETEHNLSNANEKDLPNSSFDDRMGERTLEEGSTVVYENSESKQPLSSEDLKFKNELYNSIENDHTSTIEVHSSGSSESTTYETEILSDPISPPDALGVSSSNDEATKTSSPTQKNVRSTPDFSMTNPVELTTPTNLEYADQHSDEKEMSPSEILETFMKSSRAKSKERNSNELKKTLDETKSQETTYSNENEHKSQDSFETEHNLSNADEKDLPNSSFDDHNEERFVEHGSTVVYENRESKQPLSSENLKFNNELYNSIENDHKSTTEVHSSGKSESTTYETEILTDPKLPSDALVVSSSNEEEENLSEQHDPSKDTSTTSSPTLSDVMSTPDLSTSEPDPEESTTPDDEMSPGELMGQSENREIKILIDFKNNLTESYENRNVEENALLVLTPPWNDFYKSDEIANLSREEVNHSPPERHELNSTPVPVIHGSTDQILLIEPSKVSPVDDNLSLTTETKSDIVLFTVSSMLRGSSKESDTIASSEPTKHFTKTEVNDRNYYEISTESHFVTSIKPRQEETTMNKEGTTGETKSREWDSGISTVRNSETSKNNLEFKKIYWDDLDDKEDVIPKYEYDSAQNQIEDATRKVFINEENVYNDLFVSTDNPEFEHIKANDGKKSDLNSNPETQSEASILAMHEHETPTTERFENHAFEASASRQVHNIIVPYETQLNNHQNVSETNTNYKIENAPTLIRTTAGQSTNYPERTTQRYRRTFTLHLPRQKYYEMKLPQRASKLFWFV